MQKKSKILYLDYPIVIAGGGQKSLLLLLKNIDLSKFEPFVFLPEKSQFAEFLAAEKINCSIVPIWKLFFAIKKLKPMLIHCNAPTLKYTYISAIAAKLLKIPFIWHLRVTQSAGWKDRVIAKLCTKIIVTSDAVKEKILNTGNDYKIVKIHNGVDLNSFYPDVNINNLKKEFNIKEDEFVVGAIGRMDVWKGHSYFVEMAGLLAKKLPNSKFFIVGDGAERINLESKVKDLNFPPGKFFFAGFRNDIPEFVSLFDVLVQPSDVEPFGRTVIEAMASGTPVVATNSGGPKEIIESSVDGFLSPLNSQAFAESVLKLLKDKELYKLISINARKKVEEKYDIVKQTRAIESLYIDLLTKAAVFYKCNICGSTNKKIVEWNEENKVVKCSNCGFVYLAPLPEQASLTECYQEEYFKPWISKLQEPRLKFFVKRWEKIEKPALAAKGKILDVGCGPGEFLSFAKKDGWETFGTEISAFAAAHAAKKFGLNVFTGDLREAKFPDNNFDVVTIWHVLEHMPDPSAVLKEINRIIKPSGVLVIAVPNLNNYIYMLAYTVFKLKKLKLFVMGEREIHVSFFTSKTLRNLLDKTGFKIIKETVDKGRSFWAERVIDYASGIVFNLTRKNYGIALEFHAMKKEES